MKKTIYLSVLLSLGLLGSCQKADEPQSLSTTEVQSSEGTFELRLTAEVSEDAMRALTFDGVGDLSETPKIGPTSDFTTHAFFRKKGSNQVGYAKINWLVEGTAGNLKLKLPQTNITLQNMDDQTIDEGEEWYVAGIAGGGVLNSTKDGVSFEPEGEVLEYGQLRAPLTFPWTRIRKNEMVNVTFNPRGVLLRTSVNNRLLNKIEKQVYEIQTNELDNRGVFDFSAMSSKISDLEKSNTHEPVWRFTEGSSGIATPATLSFTATNQPGLTKRSYLVWGMSRELPSGQLTRVGTTSKTTDIFRAGRLYGFESNMIMKNRQSYTIDIDVDVQNPVEYIGPFLAADGSFAVAKEQVHRFTGAELWPMLSDRGYDGSQIDQPHVFAYWDASSVIIPFYHADIKFSAASSDVLNRREQLNIGGSSYVGFSDFRSAGNGVIYALRMKKLGAGQDIPGRYSLPDDSRRLAFRWQYNSVTGVLTMSVVRVGIDPEVSLDLISNPGWWNGRELETRSISFEPIGFYRVHSNGDMYEQLDKGFGFWSRMAPGASGAYASFCNVTRLETLSSIQTISRLPLLLFRKNDVCPSSYVP
ncbi:MAG: hypothetical protein Q4A61_01145 [Porphyromonadaceae bacterium]|nr:hypothetical protein [Porphyromonadaceae bacterium]